MPSQRRGCTFFTGSPDPFRRGFAMLRSVLLATALLAVAVSTPARAEVSDIDNTELERLLSNGVSVVDIRTPEEWAQTGIIEGSHLQTFFDREGRYDARAWLSAVTAITTTGEPIVLICHSGGRSEAVSRLLSDAFGYQRVYNVHKGIAQWIAEGRPTIPHR